MEKIGLKVIPKQLAHNEERWEVQQLVGYPCIIRPNFTGRIRWRNSLQQPGIQRNLSKRLQIYHQQQSFTLINTLQDGEYEIEVVRDKNDNCIIICSIENLDPMGVHTGDSITVAPAQTLTDKEYQMIRNQSIKILREIGAETGGTNVQFAINPENGEMVVIEMNPTGEFYRSALASKATGFPIAKIAALLSVGFTLDEF